MSRNHIVVPRPPATRGPAVHSLVRAPSFPRGRMRDPRVPEAFQADSQGLAGGGCPEHREAAPPEPGAPRSRLGAACDFLSGSSSRLGRRAPPPASPSSAVPSSPHLRRDREPPSVSPGRPEPRPQPPRPRSPPRPPPGPAAAALGPATSPPPRWPVRPPRPPSRTARAGPGPGPHPRQGEVGHELLEGPRLLGLPLRVQRDLLAELPRVGAARARRGGHGARPARTGSADGRRGAPRLGPPARSAGRPSRRPKPVLRRDPAEEPPRPQSPASGRERAEVRPHAPAPPPAPRSPAPRGPVRPPSPGARPPAQY